MVCYTASMNKKKALILSVASVLIGVGVSFASADTHPTPINHQSNVKNSSELHLDEANTPAAPAAKDAEQSSETVQTGNTPVTAPQAQPQAVGSEPTEEPTPPAPAPVTVQSAVRRIDQQGLHKDYYCDLSYTDGSQLSIKIGQSDDSSWGNASLTVNCSPYVGRIK